MTVSDVVDTGKADERIRRRARFKAALTTARMTAKQWATERGGVTEQQLYAVLRGDRESATLLAKIDAFIEEQGEA